MEEKETGAEAQAVIEAVVQVEGEAVAPPPEDAVGAPVAVPALLAVA